MKSISDAEKQYAKAGLDMVKSNYSEKSIESMFMAEVFLDDTMYTSQKYTGMSDDEKQLAMKNECDEAAADNDVYDYYN